MSCDSSVTHPLIYLSTCALNILLYCSLLFFPNSFTSIKALQLFGRLFEVNEGLSSIKSIVTFRASAFSRGAIIIGVFRLQPIDINWQLKLLLIFRKTMKN
jgi:hypothetical protein